MAQRDGDRTLPSAGRTSAASQADWLDSCCWRCGSEEVLPIPDRRLLCAPCRREVFGPSETSAESLEVSAQVYWEPHALERCWLCMTASVDPADDLGLCGPCHA